MIGANPSPCNCSSCTKNKNHLLLLEDYISFKKIEGACSIIAYLHTIYSFADLNNTLGCDGYFISIRACWVWGVRVEVQVSIKEFHTYIHLDYVIIEFLFCI